MKYDAHLHVGSPEKSAKILRESIYKNKYRSYSSIDPAIIGKQVEYVKKYDDFFALPLFLKETTIEESNQYLMDFCKQNGGIPVPLIGDNESFSSENEKYFIYKEHFMMNDYLDWKDRSLFYEHLSENGGYIIIHCKDRVRKDYIEKLSKEFPGMHIIVAHLGRDVYEGHDFVLDILKRFRSNDNVLFDISTIHDMENVKNAVDIIGYDKLLYGSDFPFEYSSIDDITENQRILSETFDVSRFDKTFERIRREINGQR